jgi:hypothetical protein
MKETLISMMMGVAIGALGFWLTRDPAEASRRPPPCHIEYDGGEYIIVRPSPCSFPGDNLLPPPSTPDAGRTNARPYQ